jgi:hypothetical protein
VFKDMTNATTIATTELNSVYENATVFSRENGDQVNFSLQHYGEHQELHIAIYEADEPLDAVSDDIHPCLEPCEPDGPKELVTLSYAEVKLLKALLNRPEVAALLDQE